MFISSAFLTDLKIVYLCVLCGCQVTPGKLDLWTSRLYLLGHVKMAAASNKLLTDLVRKTNKNKKLNAAAKKKVVDKCQKLLQTQNGKNKVQKAIGPYAAILAKIKNLTPLDSA